MFLLTITDYSYDPSICNTSKTLRAFIPASSYIGCSTYPPKTDSRFLSGVLLGNLVEKDIARQDMHKAIYRHISSKQPYAHNNNINKWNPQLRSWWPMLSFHHVPTLPPHPNHINRTSYMSMLLDILQYRHDTSLSLSSLASHDFEWTDPSAEGCVSCWSVRWYHQALNLGQSPVLDHQKRHFHHTGIVTGSICCSLCRQYRQWPTS